MKITWQKSMNPWRLPAAIFVIALATVARAEYEFVDLRGASLDERMRVVCLQGLVNRDSPSVMVAFSECEIGWCARFGAHYGITFQDVSISSFVANHLGNAAGQILYDSDEAWVRSAVTTLAGVHDAVATKSDLGLPTLFDARGAWSSPTEAAQWLLDNVRTNCNGFFFAELNRDPPRDWCVAEKIFTFYLDPNDAGQKAVLRDIMRSFTPPAVSLGWPGGGVESEIVYVSMLSEEQHVFAPSDDASNFSFYRGWRAPQEIILQSPPASPGTYDPVLTYVCPIYSDGDNLQYDVNFMFDMWNEPERGSVPAGWTVNGMLHEFGPPIREMYFREACSRTVFFLTDGSNDLEYIETPGIPVTSGHRFVDGHNELVYGFALTNVDRVPIVVDLAAEFVIECQFGGGTWTQVLAETGCKTHANRRPRGFVAVHAGGLFTGTCRLRFTDSTPYDGYGPSVWSIRLLDRESVSQAVQFFTDGSNDTAWIETPGIPVNVDHRYADGTNVLVYGVSLTNIWCACVPIFADVANEYVIEAQWQDTGAWHEVARDISGTHDHTNRRGLWLSASPPETPYSGRLRIRFRDPTPADGWGPSVWRFGLPFYSESDEFIMGPSGASYVYPAGLTGDARATFMNWTEESAFVNDIESAAIIDGVSTARREESGRIVLQNTPLEGVVLVEGGGTFIVPNLWHNEAFVVGEDYRADDATNLANHILEHINDRFIAVYVHSWDMCPDGLLHACELVENDERGAYVSFVRPRDYFAYRLAERHSPNREMHVLRTNSTDTVATLYIVDDNVGKERIFTARSGNWVDETGRGYADGRTTKPDGEAWTAGTWYRWYTPATGDFFVYVTYASTWDDSNGNVSYRVIHNGGVTGQTYHVNQRVIANGTGGENQKWPSGWLRLSDTPFHFANTNEYVEIYDAQGTAAVRADACMFTPGPLCDPRGQDTSDISPDFNTWNGGYDTQPHHDVFGAGFGYAAWDAGQNGIAQMELPGLTSAYICAFFAGWPAASALTTQCVCDVYYMRNDVSPAATFTIDESRRNTGILVRDDEWSGWRYLGNATVSASGCVRVRAGADGKAMAAPIILAFPVEPEIPEPVGFSLCAAFLIAVRRIHQSVRGVRQ